MLQGSSSSSSINLALAFISHPSAFACQSARPKRLARRPLLSSLTASSSLALKIRRLAANNRHGGDGAVTSLGNPTAASALDALLLRPPNED